MMERNVNLITSFYLIDGGLLTIEIYESCNIATPVHMMNTSDNYFTTGK